MTLPNSAYTHFWYSLCLVLPSSLGAGEVSWHHMNVIGVLGAVVKPCDASPPWLSPTDECVLFVSALASQPLVSIRLPAFRWHPCTNWQQSALFFDLLESFICHSNRYIWGACVGGVLFEAVWLGFLILHISITCSNTCNNNQMLSCNQMECVALMELE